MTVDKDAFEIELVTKLEYILEMIVENIVIWHGEEELRNCLNQFLEVLSKLEQLWKNSPKISKRGALLLFDLPGMMLSQAYNYPKDSIMHKEISDMSGVIFEKITQILSDNEWSEPMM